MRILQINNLEVIRQLFFYFMIAAIIILSLVIFYTVYYSWKFKKRDLDDDSEPEQIHDNKKFEFWMIGVSLALVTGFFFYSLNAMNRIHDVPEDPVPDLVITGHQWWWEANYPQDKITTANIIHVPAGREFLVKFNSADVIHSWWIPQLGRKMDLFPGYNNYMKIFIEEPGEYHGSCSEFCGTQHGWMKIRLIAQREEEFKEWKKQQLIVAQGVHDSLFNKGKKLFTIKTCTSCHAISPSNSEPNVGPNLANFASRKYFLSNVKENTTENLKAWLRNPQEVKTGSNMPNFALSTEEINALTHYLQNLK